MAFSMLATSQTTAWNSAQERWFDNLVPGVERGLRFSLAQLHQPLHYAREPSQSQN